MAFFERYESKDVGSGLYIYLYDIDDTFGLWIGGVPSDKPIYMRLATKADMDNCIDIRTDDVTVILAGMTLWTVLMYRAFSYDGKRQMSRQIIDGVAEYVKLPWPNGRTFFGRMGD